MGMAVRRMSRNDEKRMETMSKSALKQINLYGYSSTTNVKVVMTKKKHFLMNVCEVFENRDGVCH